MVVDFSDTVVRTDIPDVPDVSVKQPPWTSWFKMKIWRHMWGAIAGQETFIKRSLSF